ncbi:phospholipase D2 isoform X1 [Anoplophora glabripennis]|uniref:phospholipase D2 isoform X1 n=2 Tax=Anoplophora glabripennis TaxID=217634 RepID=UPI0008734F67|nr:phospholipase D2 isoform X1 [Anoplophora glabripennis]
MSQSTIISMDNDEENGEINELSLTRPSLGSDGDYDDELGVPETIKLVDMGDGPVAIVNSDEELENEQIDGLPYNCIHNYKKFKSYHRNVFIPGIDINATITDYERNLTTHMLNPNLYSISLTHGNYTWEIKKRYKEIQNLHQQLVLFRTSLNIPFPSKTHKNKRKSFKENAPVSPKGKRKSALPRFPKKPEILVSFDRLGNRMKQIESYLNNLLSITIYRNHPATIEFLQVSHLSFINGLGIKGKEGLVKKKTGSTYAGCNCFGFYNCFCCVRCQHICGIICSRWVKRWFFIKDTFFGYINPDTGRVNRVVLFDQGFEVASGSYALGLHTGFQIQTLSRQLTINCWTRRRSKEWIEALKEVAATSAREFISPNPHHSFAPIRTNITASWFVDGATYMSAVADAIESAKEEVFITDWWLSPEIYLKRPAIVADYWQLDKLLERKAKQGVKIYILLYKEVEMALGLNSYYSKQKLITASENIKVLRHPDHARAGILLWAHHEKTVVIDQTFAFLGGIDLCYGRWDDDKHRLTDLGSITPTLDVSTLKKKSSSVPGGDVIYPIPVPYYKQTPLPEVQEPDTPTPEESCTLPQLEPGDDLLMPCKAPDKAKLNTPDPERKNLMNDIKDTIKNKGKELIHLVYNPHESEEGTDQPDTPDGPEVCQKDLQTPEQIIESLDGSAKFWIGKDYVNFIVKDFTNLDSPFDDFIDRVTTPRMPWHDMGVCVQGPAARDVSRHFIQRWNATKLEKAKKNDLYPYLMPKSYDRYDTLPVYFPNMTHKVTCQVLRSVSTWSCGFLEPDTVEQSIHEAYIDTITKAQHYIYIENQFFITLPFRNPNVRNQIADALYKRIVRAHKSGEVFRVFVVLPLLPGFEGEVGGASGTSLHAITHWNYSSISQGQDAILNRLKGAGIEDPSEYITFYGLRNHSTLNSEPITELIYVHSKLMIVDDKIVVCGSANINDRSLIGKRDSEIAVIIEDEAFEDGIMNGKSFPCGEFAGSLRKHLFKEHLGTLGQENEVFDLDVTDPTSDYFYREVWYKTASLNTEFYEKVFHCLPTDSVQTFGDLKKNHEEKPLWVNEYSRAQKMLDSIQGHLVLFPLNFLCKENLTPAANSVEGLMPTALWT